jgi:hypothetical protein
MPLTTVSGVKAIGNPRLPRWEQAAAITLALLTLAVKLCYIRALPVNSDEPQHLHVAWGWTQGMVQYRDFFDNHTPLFHLLTAPLVAWLGERADILLWMRLAMLPLYVICLACIYRLGARLYSRRVAVWGTLLGATYPGVLVISSQFRADVLWMTVWFATLAVTFTGRLTRERAFVGGLLLGTTFAVSLKTSLLLASLLAAWGTVLWLLPKQDRWKLLVRTPGTALAALGGLCVVPLTLIGYFAREHALSAFTYCVITHNALPEPRRWVTFVCHGIIFSTLLSMAVMIGRAILRAEADRAGAVRRALVVLTSAFFLLFLNCFWPLVTAQDYLPVVPLIALALAPLLCDAERWLGQAGKIVLAGLVAMQLAVAVRTHKLTARGEFPKQQLVADILRLTRPDDSVMDAKGETIFRRRPFYYVLENITQRRIETGSIADTVAADMVNHQTCVALLQRMPAKSREWVKRFYLRVTPKIYVAGCYLPASPPLQTRRFELAIAADYIVVSPSGPIQGTMDGAPCSGPVFLAPGPHTFTCEESGPLAIVWAQAAKTGFQPLAFLPSNRHATRHAPSL